MKFIVPNTNVHVSGKLITEPIDSLIKDTICKAKKHKIKDASFIEIAGVLTGCNLFNIDDNSAGGWFNIQNNEIVICNEGIERVSNRIHPTELMPYDKYQIKILCHEMGHALQAKAEVFEKRKWLLSWDLNMEWQVETIAYKLYNSIFGKLHHTWFNSYFTKEDMLWLQEIKSNWIENDIGIK